MKILITQFLNVMVGSHVNSQTFWKEVVTLGIYQRYGYCSLINERERLYLYNTIVKMPWFIKVSYCSFEYNVDVLYIYVL